MPGAQQLSGRRFCKVTIRSGDVAPRLQQQDGGRRFLLVPLWWAGELLGALTVVWGPAADAVATAAAATKEGLPTAAATAGRGKSSNGNTTPFVWRGAAGKGSRRVRDERAIGSSSSKGGSSSGGAGCGGATATVCISEPPQQQVPVLLPREVEEQEAAAAAHLMRLGLFGSSAAHVALLRRACGLAAAAAYPRASWVVIGGGGCGRSSSTCCVGELLQALSGGAEAILNDRHQLWHTPQHLSVLAAAVLHPPPSPSAGVAAPATATAAAAGSTGDGANSAQLAHLLPAHPRLRAIRTSHSRHDDDGSHDATAAATAQGPPQQPPPPGGWAGPAETATLAFFPLTASAAPQAPATPAPPNDYCYSPLPVSTSQPSTPLSAVANNGLLHQRSSFSLHLQRQMQQQLKPQHLRRSVQGVDPELTLLGQAAAAAAATDANATPPTVLATAAGGAVVGTSSETTATVLLPDCAGELMREEGHVPLDVMMAARRLVAAPLAVAASASPQAVATGACQTTNGGAVGSAAAVCAVPRQLSAAAAAGCSSSNSSGAAVQQQAQLPVLGLVLCSGGAIAEGFLAAVAEDAATIVQICNGALRDALRPPLPGAVAGPDATAGSPAAAANCWQQLLLHDGHCGCYCRAAEAASATASARAAVASDDPHHQLQSQQLQQGGVQDADAHEREREREQERVCTLLGTMMSGGLNPQLEDMVVDTPRVAAVRQQSYGHGQGHGHAQNGRMFTRRGSSTMTGHDVMLGSSAASVCPMAMAAAAAAATAGTAAGADSCDAADGRSMSAALRWRSPQTSHLGMILTTGGTNGCMSGAGGGAAGCGGGVGGLAASGTAIDSALFGDPLMTTVSITSGTNGLFRGLGAAGGGGGTGGGGSTTATGAHATAASLLAAATTPAPPISPMQVMIQTITTSIAQTLSATERTDSPERQLEDLSALTLLGEPLGWGGQGVVFRGTLHALEVAVKVCAYTDAYSTPLPSPPPSAFWLLPTAASAGVASATQSGAGLAAPVAAGEGMNGPALLSAAAVGTAAAAGAAAGFGGGASPPLLPPGAHNSFNTYSCTPIRHSSRAGGGWAAAAYACGGGDTAGRSGGSSSGGPMAAANVAAAATATEATAAAATATTPTSSTSNSRAGFRAAANTSRRGAASVAGEVDGVGTSGAATAGAGATAGAAAHHPAAVLVGGVGAAGNTTSGSSSRVRATRFASEPPTQLATATTLAAAPATAATAGGGAAAVPRGNWGAGAATPTAPSPFLRTRGVSVDSAAVAATATRAAAVGQASQQAAAAAVAASDTAATLITAGSTASAATVPLASPAGTPRGTAAAAAYLQSAPCSTGGGGGGGGGGSAAGSCVLQSGEWPRPGAGAGAGAAKHDLNKVSMLRNAAELAVCSALPGHPHLVQLFGYHTEVQLVISQPPLQPSPPHAPATANAAAATAEAAASSAAAAAAAVARGAAAVEHQRPLALVPSHLVPHLGLPVVQLQQLQQPAQLQLLQPAAAHAAALQPQQHHLALVMEYCDSGDLRTAAEAGWLLRAPEPWEEAAAAGCGGGGGGGMWGGRVLDMRAIYTTLLEVALALRHLHRHGLAHCDVKPSNILLRSSPRDPRGWTAKLSDFGCVRLLRPQPQPQPQSAPHTQHGMLPQASQHGGGAALGGGGSGGHSSSRSSGWLLAGGGCGVGNPSPPPPPPPAVPADDSHHQHRCWSPSVAAPVSPPPAGFRVLHLPVGSFTHSAPELFVRGAWLDASLDVYALGIVMWELASLAPVYPAGMSPPEVARLVLAGARPVFAPHRLQQLLRAHEAAVAAAAAAAAATAAAAAATAAAATAASAAAVEQQQQAREMKRQGNEFQQPRANPNAQYLTATLAPPPPPPQQPQPQQEQKQDIGMHLSAVISDVTVADPGGGCGGGYGSYFGCAEPFPLLHAAAADGVDFSPWGGGGAAAGVAIVPEDEPLFVLMRAAAGGGGGSGGSGGGGNASNRGVAAAAAATTFGAAGIAAGAGGGDRRAGGSRWLG
ncbi:hypothetical protein HXX76_002257 [Chlamydomonas incerta]|uniref:Protein kinase domain-containing protein n=1 Tax=Chlamydomonas incerta TaxID=51695 RepID=A0A836B0I0_CHLIN|nr:hypothetical protein HXX76_002257 [Chlamydomonas incerta]|eukprot:KAG2443917.1 hypothetical protein HXX76_002257 [Chlamydomonas incerta]